MNITNIQRVGLVGKAATSSFATPIFTPCELIDQKTAHNTYQQHRRIRNRQRGHPIHGSVDFNSSFQVIKKPVLATSCIGPSQEHGARETTESALKYQYVKKAPPCVTIDMGDTMINHKHPSLSTYDVRGKPMPQSTVH